MKSPWQLQTRCTLLFYTDLQAVDQPRLGVFVLEQKQNLAAGYIPAVEKSFNMSHAVDTRSSFIQECEPGQTS